MFMSMTSMGRIERLIEFCRNDEGLKREMDIARQEFFGTGVIVYGSEDEFRARMTEMLEWFLFDRVVGDTGMVPVDSFLINENLDEDEREKFERMKHTIYGVFEVVEVDIDSAKLRHILDDGVYIVSELPATFTISHGGMLIGRIFQGEDGYSFSLGIKYWPEMNRYLREGFEELRSKGLSLSVDPVMIERVLQQLSAEGGTEGCDYIVNEEIG